MKSIGILSFIVLSTITAHCEGISESDAVLELEKYFKAVQEKNINQINAGKEVFQNNAYIMSEAILGLCRDDEPAIKPWLCIPLIHAMSRYISSAEDAVKLSLNLMNWDPLSYQQKKWFMEYQNHEKNLPEEVNTLYDFFAEDYWQIIAVFFEQYPKELALSCVDEFVNMNFLVHEQIVYLLISYKDEFSPLLERKWDKETEPVIKAKLFIFLQACGSSKIHNVKHEEVFTTAVKKRLATEVSNDFANSLTSYRSIYGDFYKYSYMKQTLARHKGFNAYLDMKDLECQQLVNQAKSTIEDIVRKYVDTEPLSWAYDVSGLISLHKPDDPSRDLKMIKYLMETYQPKCLSVLSEDELLALASSFKSGQSTSRVIGLSLGILFLSAARETIGDTVLLEKVDDKLQASAYYLFDESRNIPGWLASASYRSSVPPELGAFSLAILALRSLEANQANQLLCAKVTETKLFLLSELAQALKGVAKTNNSTCPKPYALGLAQIALLKGTDNIAMPKLINVVVSELNAMLLKSFNREYPLNISYAYDRPTASCAEEGSAARAIMVHQANYYAALKGFSHPTKKYLWLSVENYLRYHQLLMMAASDLEYAPHTPMQNIGSHFYHASVLWCATSLNMVAVWHHNQNKTHGQFIKTLLQRIGKDGLFQREGPDVLPDFPREKPQEDYAQTTAYCNFTGGLALLAILATEETHMDKKMRMLPLMPVYAFAEK